MCILLGNLSKSSFKVILTYQQIAYFALPTSNVRSRRVLGFFLLFFSFVFFQQWRDACPVRELGHQHFQSSFAGFLVKFFGIGKVTFSISCDFVEHKEDA